MRKLLATLLIASLVWAQPALASLNFDGASRTVNCGSAFTDASATWTAVWWLRLTTLGGDDVFFQHSGAKANVNPGDTNDVEVIQSRVTTVARYVTNTSILSTGTDLFLAIVYNESGGANEVFNIYSGSLTAIASEATYVTNGDGAGANNGGGGNFHWGSTTSSGDNLAGQISFAAWTDTALTAAQIISLQYAPLRSAHLFDGAWMMGAQGTGTQVDYSGSGNTCSVTSATVADNVASGPWWAFAAPESYVVAAGGGGGAPPLRSLLGVGN